MRTRMLTLASLAMATTIALAGCGTQSTDHGSGHGGSTPTDGASAAASFNDADVMFATMMIPHHQQAIEMSDLVLGKEEVDPEVAELAQKIKDAQGPEIEQLEGWLQDWGKDGGSPMKMDHGDHGDGGSMDGMMSEADMSELESADGPTASTLFLEQMIEHHEGAVEMAKTQVKDGQHTEAVKLAQTVVDSQSGEIDEMRTLLSKL